MKTLMTMVAVAGLALAVVGCGDTPAPKAPTTGGKVDPASKMPSMQPDKNTLEKMKKDGGVTDEGGKAADADKADGDKADGDKADGDKADGDKSE